MRRRQRVRYVIRYVQPRYAPQYAPVYVKPRRRAKLKRRKKYSRAKPFLTASQKKYLKERAVYYGKKGAAVTVKYGKIGAKKAYHYGKIGAKKAGHKVGEWSKSFASSLKAKYHEYRQKRKERKALGSLQTYGKPEKKESFEPIDDPIFKDEPESKPEPMYTSIEENKEE